MSIFTSTHLELQVSGAACQFWYTDPHDGLSPAFMFHTSCRKGVETRRVNRILVGLGRGESARRFPISARGPPVEIVDSWDMP